MKRMDLFIGIYLMAAVVFFIVPIPSVMLDFFITFNLIIAMVILFTALYAKETLEMSSFPTILLFTTIFRIALNVSSTRLILLNGDPGDVVKAFGSFVGGGSLVVGAIIFIVLVIVQMLVINKGSERVSEVTARFTLDAMPGKQMAIDADLNTGAITDAEAKIRREKIQEESAFFGSMDGATKYVKGDATAGLIITMINLVGGIITGVTMQGMTMQDALNTYTILTIGDGLVSQIPSMLISLSTGIIVTKASKSENIGNIMVGQLFHVPKVMYMVGAVMIVLGMIPAFPTLIYLGFGLAMIVLGRILSTEVETAEIEKEVEEEEVQADEIRRHENVNSLLQVDPIELEFGYGIIPLADVNQGGDLLDRVVMIRRQIALELGAVVPIIRLRDNIQLNPNQYIIKIKGIQVSEGEILFDHYMAMNPGYVEEEITGIPTFEPSFNLPALWITEGQRERAGARITEKRQKQMKSIKKKMSIALAGIILAGSMGWSQLPVRAATNGETICSHRTSRTERTATNEYRSIYAGHMRNVEIAEWCTDVCKQLVRVSFEYGDLEAHGYTEWKMVEDRGDGLYRFQRWCTTCGYEDETLSDDPKDPKE